MDTDSRHLRQSGPPQLPQRACEGVQARCAARHTREEMYYYVISCLILNA